MTVENVNGIDWMGKMQRNEAALDGEVTGALAASDVEAVAGTLDTVWLTPGNLVAAMADFDFPVYTMDTLTSATPSTTRQIRSELTLTPSTTLAVSGAGSLAAIRGALTLTTGKSMTSGFLYGVQGKLVLDGATINVGSGHIAGLYGQMSANGTTLTSGHVAIGILSGQNLPTSANVDGLYLESGGGKINSVIKSNVKATYFLDISDFETAGICSATGTPGVCTGATGWIKVYVAGAVRYIPLASSVS